MVRFSLALEPLVLVGLKTGCVKKTFTPTDRLSRRLYSPPMTWPLIVWPFEDPTAFVGTEDQNLAKFRQVRDQIEAKIKTWLAGLK